MGFLKVYQIYFLPEQLQVLDYIPYLNDQCTVFFESQVMADLITEGCHKDSEYFGVVSYKLRNKLGYTKTAWRALPNIANHSINTFTPQMFEFYLERNAPDAMSFQRHMPHDPVTFADQFHPGFSDFFKTIMHKIGYNWQPMRIENVFYCNYFVAKRDIYEDFVINMLIPAINVMKEMPELMANSNYQNGQLPEALAKKWGINHYPYHAFLTERMFSYYSHLKQLKCLHY